jgi:hypothetical protein
MLEMILAMHGIRTEPEATKRSPNAAPHAETRSRFAHPSDTRLGSPAIYAMPNAAEVTSIAKLVPQFRF